MLTHRADIIEEIKRRRLGLTLNLLRVYNFYRVLVGLALLVFFIQQVVVTRLGNLAPDLFLYTTLVYLGVNLASLATLQILPSQRLNTPLVSAGLVAYDILMLTLLMYFSGGVSSGLGMLILVSVATGAIIVTGRLTAVLPAIASIAALYQEFYLSLSAPQMHDDFFQAGILGMLYFGASSIIQRLSGRVRDNDLRALTQAAELSDLERVNRQIIHRMQTGIIVVDPTNRVRTANQSARALVGLGPDEALTELPEALNQHLVQWRKDTERRVLPFRIDADTPEIRVSFFAVRAGDPQGDITVFIEDTGEIQQQAQQLKLAALGRLSASIAHEIRNPLGAISHAAQLLGESENLDVGDRRLTGIIHTHCQRMNGVIQNVLEMSRRRLPAPVRLNLADYLQEFEKTFRETNHAACIDTAVDTPAAEFRMDKSQLDQVLNNLVNNAIRHSCDHSGSPYVRLEGGIDPRTERPYLNVIDKGPGVDEAESDKLFEPFYTTERSGTGLGLYISRELCETNQARLTCYRHEQDGSCFRISFAHPDRIFIGNNQEP